MGPLDIPTTKRSSGGFTQTQQGKMDAISGAATAAASIVGDGLAGIQEAKNINTNAPTQQFDSFGRPMYNVGDFASQVASMNPSGASGFQIAGSTLKGAAVGAQFGGPIGAAIGGAVGGISTALFGARKKTLERRKKSLARGNLFAAQQNYNQQTSDYFARQSAQSLYNNQFNSENRMSSVFNALS